MKKLYFNWKNYPSNLPIEIIKKLYTNQDKDFVVFPSDVYLYQIINEYKIETSKVGVQNTNHLTDKNGAYTGMTPLSALVEYNLFGSIVGHSEVRKNLKIDIESCLNQINFLNSNGLKSVVCIGTANTNSKEDVCKSALDDVKLICDYILQNKLDVRLIEIAYEPMWAIGTGLSATREDIDEFLIEIRSILDSILGKNNIPILYGGSVSSKNIDDLNKSTQIDGYLIGGASIKNEELDYIFRSIN